MTKINKKKSTVGIGCMIAGVLFLFNPIIGIVDILPDFIGYLLIYRGLFMPSFCTEKLRDTRGFLWKLAVITAVRTASLLMLPGKSESFTLLLVFVFAVLESVYAIPCVLRLFDGFYDLGRQFDAKSVFAPQIKTVKGKPEKRVIHGQEKIVREKVRREMETAEKLKTFTVLFFLLRTAAAVLPELTALAVDYDLSSAAYYRMSLSVFKPYFYILAVTVTLVFGVIWLVRTLRYLIGMKHDAVLSDGIRAHYEETVISDAGFAAAIHMKNVLLMFMLSAVALFPLQFDSVSVLPSAVFSLILVLALRVLSRFDSRARFGYIPAAGAAILSIIGTVLQVPYFAEYIAKDARYLTNAIRLYKPIRILGTVEFLCVLALFLWFVILLCRVLKKHAALVGGPSYGLQYSAEARSAEIFKSVYGRVVAFAVIGAAYILLRAASFTAAMYFEAIWGVQVIAALIFVAVVIYGVSAMNDMIYERLENRY